MEHERHPTSRHAIVRVVQMGLLPAMDSGLGTEATLSGIPFMSGFTPLYDTMLSGTLYGRWPHTGIWACLLSRATREGVIDETPQSLAAAMGVSVDILMECISDFMQPDPDSRTVTHEGRRLVLIDPARKWGWVVVNHGKYREKARKRNFDEQRKESGENAARMKERREDPTGPAKTREDPLSSPSPSEDSRRAASGEPDSFDKALFVEARRVFGQSCGGQINRAIREQGKPFVVEMIDACRSKDPEAARAYLAAAMKNPRKKQAELRRSNIA